MRYRHRPVVVVPKARIDEVNTLLQRHGYGPNVVSVPVHGKASSSNAPATHYAVECVADDAMLAALKVAVGKAAGASVDNAKRGKASRMDAVLDGKNLKQKKER
jgi:hypothetical protein